MPTSSPARRNPSTVSRVSSWCPVDIRRQSSIGDGRGTRGPATAADSGNTSTSRSRDRGGPRASASAAAIARKVLLTE